MLAAKCALFVFTQWFMNFVGLFLRASFGYTQASSTNAISVANAGQMVGLLVGGKYYKKLVPADQFRVIAAGLVVTAVVPCVLMANEAVPAVKAAVLPLLFLWGLCFAVPFYIPAGTYALECGGKKHGALFTNLFDAGGFTASSVWNWYAAEQSRLNRFDNLLFSLACLGGVAAFSMPLAMYRRLPARAKAA